jgi:2'-5' RNA ligase
LTAPATLRAFIAVELPTELHTQLGALIVRLSRDVPASAVRWVRPEGIHLTLKFLGDMPASQREPVQDMVTLAAREAEAFECRAAGIGCFPNLKQPRVIWAGLNEPSGFLSHLQRAVEGRAARLGYPREAGDRVFNPHLTLGRVNRQAGKEDLRRLAEAVQARPVDEMGVFRVEAISLMKSDLQPGGSVYTRLFQARLGEPTAAADESR